MSRVASSRSKTAPRKRAVKAAVGEGKSATNSQQLSDLMTRLFGGMGGTAVSPDAAMRVGTVYACVRILAESVALLPLRIMRTNGDEAKPDPSHPVSRIFRLRPSPAHTAFEYKRLAMVHMLLAGNHYALKRKGGVRIGGKLVPGLIGLEPFADPRAMEVTKTDNLTLQYKYPRPGGGMETYQQDEIFHLRSLSTDGVKGLSVLEAAANAVGVALNAEKHGARILQNGANIGGVLEHPGQLTAEAVKRLRDSFDARFAGADNAGKTVLLEEGMKFNKVGMTADEAQFIESRKFQRSDIGMFFGVPPHMYGDIERGTSWGSGIEQQGVGFVTYTLLPWLTNIALSIDCSLLDPTEQDDFAASFDTEPLTRAEFLVRQQGREIQARNGVLSPDEWRRTEGMGPRADGGGKDYSKPGASPQPQKQQSPTDDQARQGQGTREAA